MKLLRRLAAVFIALPVLVVAVFAVPSPTTDFYCNDFAGVLTRETEDYILAQSRALDEATTAQVVVAVVESLEGKPIEQFGLELGRAWVVGAKEQNNGLIILLAPNERELRIEVGYGLEGAINDAKTGRLMDDYAIPYLSNDQWDMGVRSLYTAVLAEVYQEYGLEPPDSVNPIPLKQEDADEEGLSPIVILVLVLLVAMVFNGMGGGGRGGRRRRSVVFFPTHGGFGGGFHGGGSRGGGFGGGGGFSGGGGSFGGGGGSRKF